MIHDLDDAIILIAAIATLIVNIVLLIGVIAR